MIFAIDFDGTCVTHEYPKVGKNIGAAPILRELVKQGHKIILWTMRSDPNGDLKDALDWFEKENITLYGVNSNPEQSWSNSPKAFAHMYIDDAALGCPLVLTPSILISMDASRPFVDWLSIQEYLDSKGILVLTNQEYTELSNAIADDIQ